MTSESFAGAGSLFLILAILAGTVVSLFEAKRREICSGTVLRFTMAAVPLSALTARLLFAVVTSSHIDFQSGFLTGWSGRTILYGAMAGYTAAALLIAKTERISYLSLLDMLAPGTALALAVGRLASFFNGSCFGQAVTFESLRFFPIGVYVQSIRSWLYAVFIYEAVYVLLVFIVLLLIRNKMKTPGDLAAWFALLYACGRVVSESARADSLYIGFVNISQVISILLTLTVLVVFSVHAIKSRRFRAVDLLGWLGALLCVAAAFYSEFTIGAENAMRNTALLSVSMALLVLISSAYYRSIRQRTFQMPSKFISK